MRLQALQEGGGGGGGGVRRVIEISQKSGVMNQDFLPMSKLSEPFQNRDSSSLSAVCIELIYFLVTCLTFAFFLRY